MAAVAAVWTGMATASAWLLLTYGRGLPFGDDWDGVQPIAGNERLLPWLLQRYGEHVLIIPKLAMFASLRLSRCDYRVLPLVCLGMMAAVSAGLVTFLARRRGYVRLTDALRSLVKLGRTLGLVGWSLEVEGVRGEAYRDTRGPGREGFKRLLAQLDGRSDAKAIRDRAFLHLLYDLALRRAEVCALDVWDVDPEARTLAILGKCRTEKSRLTLPPETLVALAAWLQIRGPGGVPLFHRLDRAGRGAGRLTGAAIYLMVRSLGRRAGLETRPHGLRHAAVTEALDLTGGDVRAVQKFSRHRDVRTLQRYDDNARTWRATWPVGWQPVEALFLQPHAANLIISRFSRPKRIMEATSSWPEKMTPLSDMRS